jgi:hypothetical protein
MQKMMIVLMVSLGSSNSNAFEDLQSTPKKSYECVNNNSFLEQNSQMRSAVIVDEYSNKEDGVEVVGIVEVDDVDDYEQAISNDVQPPKISAAQQMLAKVFGELLVRYISMREIARVYFHELKAALNNWYSKYITSA